MKKLDLLSLGVAGWLLLAGCDTEVRVIDDADSAEGKPAYASFALNIKDPKTYAGDADEAGQGNENAIKDALLLIYKLDGTPEAMGYIATADILAGSQENSEATARVTLQCTSGDKLIYLATNVGGNKLIDAGQTTTNVSETNAWLGAADWSAEGGIPFAEVNTPVWSAGASSIAISSTAGTATVADGLIKALSGNGDPSQGVLSGIGTAYLMSNWGDASSQQTDGGGTGTDYASTCKFTLQPNIEATETRAAIPDATNANGKNALLINIQRALAMVAMEAIPSQVLNSVGSGSNAGVFVPDDKWAVGNINMSVYPFQQYDGSAVKSTRYDDTASIIPASGNQNWENKMDNSRWIPADKTYISQNLTITEIRNQINSHPANQPFGLSNRVLITENNNKAAYIHYSTFILYSGQYRPNSYVTGVGGDRVVSTSNTFPESWPATNPVTNEQTDTLYYVSNIDDGTFFLGKKALRQYIGYIILGLPPSSNVATNTGVADYINSLMTPTGNTQARLQVYYRGYCLYREWIKDASATLAANKTLVRRNHIYYLSVAGISGPGIGEALSIIDPDPETVDPVEEPHNCTTTQIRIMNWHIVHQTMVSGPE
jgi:hypothetical protein